MSAVTHIKFGVDQQIHSVGGEDPDDSWSRDSTEGSVSIRGAQIVSTDSFNVLSIAADVQPGTKVFLVWAQYSTGDSFGSYGGQYELLEVLVDESIANARADFYRQVTDYSVPWNGYFEDLDFVRVDELILEPTA